MMLSRKGELQQFLKNRGVRYAGETKEQLVAMCKFASESQIDVDPDGLMEDISGVIATELRLESGEFLTSPLLQGFADISFIPEITVFDICNNMITRLCGIVIRWKATRCSRMDVF